MSSRVVVIRRLLGFAIAELLVVSAALAQESAPKAVSDEPVTEVVITGSRIRQPNEVSASPVQVFTSAEIEATGKSDISDILNRMPQIFNNDLGQDFGNRTTGLTTAGGIATANLRGLGPSRTLVMIDGRRLGQGSPYTFIQSPAPDIDQVPLFMVDRVDVVTGGASAVYGSDAIAGVVNFVLKKNFQGLQFDAQLGQNWHNNHNSYARGLLEDFGEDPLTGSSHDGKSQIFNMIAGTNFAEGQGNVTAWLTYYHQDPVSSGQRDFGQCQMNSFSSNQRDFDGAICAGSSNSNFFNPLTGPFANVGYSVAGNEFVPRGSVETTPPASFNSQPFIFMQRDDDRYLAGFNVHYELSDHVQPYGQFGFMDDRTTQKVAPSALFRGSNPNDPGTGNYFVNCGNPFLSAQQQTILGCTAGQISGDQSLRENQVNVEIGRRNIEGGDRVSIYRHTNYRGVVGASGDIASGWAYDAYAQYYYTSFFNSNDKYLNFRNIDNALLVTTDSSGNPRCVGDDVRCVPYNIWQDGGVTQGALSYLSTIGTGQGDTTLVTYHADVTGELGEYGLKSPLANDGVALNFGWEHRNEQVNFTPDSAEQSGQLSGFGSAASGIGASVSVDEQFVEFRLPLIQDRAGAQDLVISPGFRRSDYSSVGSINTWKVDLLWSPIDDLRLRGSYQHATRAPSIVELFNQPLVGLIQLGNDPCAPSSPGLHDAPSSLADCLNTVAPSQAAAFTAAYNAGSIPNSILGQLSARSGGNEELTPEKSKSYSFGFLFSPQALPGLSGSIDYWDIKLDRAIGVIPANVILSSCLASGDPAYCSQIVRQPNTFSLTGNAVPTGGYIIQQNFNIGTGEVSGIDLQSTYNWKFAKYGSLRFAMNGSYLLENKTSPLPGAPAYDCAGLFGSTCQTVNPRWRHIFGVTWATPLNLDVGVNWRFIGKVSLDNNDNDPTLHYATFGAFNSFAGKFPSFSYFDLNASWHAWDKLEIGAGINNVFDKDPPLATFEITSGGAANTYSTYEALGRQLFISFTAKF